MGIAIAEGVMKKGDVVDVECCCKERYSVHSPDSSLLGSVAQDIPAGHIVRVRERCILVAGSERQQADTRLACTTERSEDLSEQRIAVDNE